MEIDFKLHLKIGGKTLENKKTKNVGHRCKVVIREISIDDAQKLLDTQSKYVTPNQRKEGESAFEKALKGSQLYLKHKGIIE